MILKRLCFEQLNLEEDCKLSNLKRAIEEYTLCLGASIKDAVEIIDKGSIGIVVVVDNDFKLIGTITDGDVRRGLLKGYSLDEKVDLILNKNSISCRLNDSKQKMISVAEKFYINQIPVLDENETLIHIETFHELHKDKKHDNIVFLMAGGLGTRLRPLTESTPKPMLKVGDKTILEHIINKFKEYGYLRFVISINYLGEQIRDFFGNGASFGVEIEYILEKEKLGTAGSLSLLENLPTRPFFVMNADLVTELNLEQLLLFHEEHDGDATICIRKYEIDIPYGVVKVENSQLESIEEKPKHHFFINAGIYVLEPSIIKYIPKNQYLDMPTFLSSLKVEGSQITTFPLREKWIDIGLPKDYDRANRDY